MASKWLLDNLSEETGLSKGTKLEQKQISVTISNKHPEIDIDDHEIQKVLLIFNLLIEVETNKVLIKTLKMEHQIFYWQSLQNHFNFCITILIQ